MRRALSPGDELWAGNRGDSGSLATGLRKGLGMASARFCSCISFQGQEEGSRPRRRWPNGNASAKARKTTQEATTEHTKALGKYSLDE